MAEEQYYPLERRRKGLAAQGWEEIFPTIFIGGFRQRADGYTRFVHLCDKVKDKYAYGGYVYEGRCNHCDLILSDNIQFMMKLLEFKG